MKPFALHRFLAGLALAAGLHLPAQGAAPAFVWLEGESAKTDFKASVGGWGRPQFLSESNWLHISVDEGKVEKEMPEAGILLDYAFQSPKAARYEVWNRVGFEFVRSALRVAPGRRTVAEVCSRHPHHRSDGNGLLERGGVAEDGRRGFEPPARTASKSAWPNPRPTKANGSGCFTPQTPFACMRDRSIPTRSSNRAIWAGVAADEAAAKTFYPLPETKPSERSSVKLGGVWEIARDDEQLPGEVAEPIQALPQHPLLARHHGAPATRNHHARRLALCAPGVWYRARISVPASMAGRAFYVDFPYNNP